MFAVTEVEASMIRTALEQRGEFAAVVELRGLFRGLDIGQARRCVRMIAGWRPLPMPEKSRRRQPISAQPLR